MRIPVGEVRMIQPQGDPQESLLSFPCDFDVKAFGRAGEGFEAHVVALVGRYAPSLTSESVSVRASRAGRYVAVTMTIRATSKEQLEAIAVELKGDPRVLGSF